jgi:hypothetical protein
MGEVRRIETAQRIEYWLAKPGKSEHLWVETVALKARMPRAAFDAVAQQLQTEINALEARLKRANVRLAA